LEKLDYAIRASYEEIKNIGVDTIDNGVLNKDIVFELALRLMILM